MKDDAQWTKLFRYLDERFAVVDDKLEAHDQRFDRLDTTLDGIASVIDDQATEQVAMKSQLNRHDRWIHQLAHKLGLKLKTGA